MIVVPGGKVFVQAGASGAVQADTDLPGVVAWATAGATPAWATVDAVSGLVSLAPTAADVGAHVVELSATVGAAVDHGAFEVVVRPAGLVLGDLVARREPGADAVVHPRVYGLVNPAAWAATGLPDGWTLDGATGAMAGPFPEAEAVVDLSVVDPLARAASCTVRLVPLAASPVRASFRAGGRQFAGVGERLSRLVDVAGGRAPYLPSIEYGFAWAEVAMADASTAVLGGVVEADPVGPVRLRFDDADGEVAFADLWLDEAPAVEFGVVVPPLEGEAGAAWPPDARVDVRGGALPISLAVDEGPAGSAVDARGRLSGRFPAEAGVALLRVRATDADGRQAFGTGRVTTVGPPFAIVQVALSVVAGQQLAAQPATTGGAAVRWWSTGGAPFIRVDASTGAISGQAGATPSTSVLTLHAVAATGETASLDVRVAVVSGQVSCSVPVLDLVRGEAGHANIQVQHADSGWSARKVSGSAHLSVSANGRVSWPALGASDSAGATLVVEVARTADGATARCQRTPRIADAPVVAAPACSTASSAFGWPSVVQSDSSPFSVSARWGAGGYVYAATATRGSITSQGGGQFRYHAPSSLGADEITVTVTDSDGRTGTCTVAVSVVDRIAPTLACSASDIDVVSGSDAEGSLASASGGSPSYEWSATGLPASVELSSAGALSGSWPDDASDTEYNVQVRVRDQDGAEGVCSLTVTVGPPGLACPATPDVTLEVRANVEGHVVLPAPANATGAVSYSVFGPGWVRGRVAVIVRRDGQSVYMSGHVVGEYTWRYSATDDVATCFGALGRIVVRNPVLVCNVGSRSGGLNEELSAGVSARGGAGGYAYALKAGHPAAVSLDGSDVVLAAQSSAGVFAFTVVVTDSAGASTECSGRLTVS